MKHIALAIALCASPAFASSVPEGLVGGDVIFLGETHDNPDHHARQAEWSAALGAKALVFEMLTVNQAAAISPDLRGDEAALAEVLDWDGSGWPDFAMYYPIFAAVPEAGIYGAAVPRGEARAAMAEGVATWFGAEEATRFGLDQPLSEDEQAAREEMQMRAHCDALPEELLPAMVDVQRLRDAIIARAAAQALVETGGPVVVITGNGHARADRGAPVYLTHAMPEIDIRTLGQSEDGALDGAFDATADSPGVERDDPCAAFAKDG